MTDESGQEQETNEVAVQTPETVGSLLNDATQENLAQESQLVEVEPAIQKEVVFQDISAPQADFLQKSSQIQLVMRTLSQPKIFIRLLSQ